MPSHIILDLNLNIGVAFSAVIVAYILGVMTGPLVLGLIKRNF